MTLAPKVGDELFLAHDEPRCVVSNHEVVVTAVGRKWASFHRKGMAYGKPERFDFTDPNWPVDTGGYGGGANIWSSKEAWMLSMARKKRFRALARVLEYKFNCPRGVQIADVDQAAWLLGVRDEYNKECER